MSLVYQSSKWAEMLWQGHVKEFDTAKRLLSQGKEKNYQFPGLAQSTHDALYFRHMPDAQTDPPAPPWALTLLEQAQQLPEWQRLRARCQQSGFAAGIATESMLNAILDLMPEQQGPQKPKRGRKKSQQAPGQGQGQGDASPGEGEAQSDEGAARRTLREACRQAEKEVEQAEKDLDVFGEVGGLQAGTGAGTHEQAQHIDDVRKLYHLIKSNRHLRHIGELAGRMLRLGQYHKRITPSQAPGAVRGITLGGDLDRLLPSEVVGIRSPHKFTRLAALAKIQERRALQYDMRGDEQLIKGPIINCVDESGSMGHGEGSPASFAKAVTLALLTQAMQQKRAFCYVGFDDDVTQIFLIKPGEVMTPDALLQMLGRSAGGGTNFTRPLRKAMDVLTNEATMHKADVIFTTDGEAPIDSSALERFAGMRTRDSVHLYQILIGMDAKNHNALEQITDAKYSVTAKSSDVTTIAPLMAATS